MYLGSYLKISFNLYLSFLPTPNCCQGIVKFLSCIKRFFRPVPQRPNHSLFFFFLPLFLLRRLYLLSVYFHHQHQHYPQHSLSLSLSLTLFLSRTLPCRSIDTYVHDFIDCSWPAAVTESSSVTRC